MTKVYDNATDLITFARSSSGTALRRVGYGDELVTNDDFATDTDWTKGAGWTIGSGTANKAAGIGDAITQADGSMVAGHLYAISYTVSGATTGVCAAMLTADTQVTGNLVGGNGDRTEYLQGTPGVDGFGITANASFDGSIDNVSVKQVIFDRPTDDLVLFNHPDDIPRIEYGSDGSLKGLLIEEQRTNLVTTSTDISGGNWVDNGGVITENAVTAPDGTQTGSTYDTDGAYRILRNLVSVTAGTTYTWSFYAKNIDATDVRYRVYDNTQAVDIVSATKYFSQINTSDWTRVSVSFTAPAGCSQAGVYLTSGTNGGSVAFWGFQLEEGSFPTSYIPTSGSTVTRSPDIASIPVSSFGYNQEAGTVVVEFSKMYPDAAYNRFHAGFGANSGNYVGVGYSSAQRTYVQPLVGAISVSGASAPSPGGFATVAAGFDASGATAAVDGQSNSATAIGAAPAFSSSDTLYLGSSAYYASEIASGHIKSLSYYPRRLTDAQLQELTS